MSYSNPVSSKHTSSLYYVPAKNHHPHCGCPRLNGGQCSRFKLWWDNLQVNNIFDPPLYHLINNLLRTEIPFQKQENDSYVKNYSLNEDANSFYSKIKEPTSVAKSHKDIINIQLCSEIILSKEIINHIEVDIRRTFPSIYFFDKYGSIQLRRILQTYAFYDPEIGYVQGMNFIAGFLLWHSTEQDAFWMLTALMYLRDLRQMYLPNFPGLFKRCSIIETLIHQNLPKLHDHLKDVGINSLLYSSEWLLTLFTNSVPFEALNSIWDKFITHGWNFIYKIILKKISKNEDKILESYELDAVLGLIKYGDPKGKPSNHSKVKLEKQLSKSVFDGIEGEERRGIVGSAFSRFQKIFNKPENIPPDNNSSNFWTDLILEAASYSIEGHSLRHLGYSSYLRDYNINENKSLSPIFENWTQMLNNLKPTNINNSKLEENNVFSRFSNSDPILSYTHSDLQNKNESDIDNIESSYKLSSIEYTQNSDDSDIVDIDVLMNENEEELENLRYKNPCNIDNPDFNTPLIEDIDDSQWVNVDTSVLPFSNTDEILEFSKHVSENQPNLLDEIPTNDTFSLYLEATDHIYQKLHDLNSKELAIKLKNIRKSCDLHRKNTENKRFFSN